MKMAFQILIHALAALAGFCLVPTPELQTTESAAQAVKKTKLTTQITPSSQTTVAVSPRSHVDRLAAILNPQKWTELFGLVEKARVEELPVMLQMILSSRFPDTRRRAVELLFKRWTVLDRTGAIAALRTITSPQLKDTALSRILFEWAKSDTAAAWQCVLSLDDDPVLQETGIESLLANGADKDPQGYITWATQIEDPFLRYKAFDQIASTWSRNDPKASFAAGLNENDPVLRRRLLETASHQDASKIDPAMVMDLLLQLPDKAERIELLSDHWTGAVCMAAPKQAVELFVSHSNNPDLQKMGGMLGRMLAQQVKTIGELRTTALRIPEGPLRDAFVAEAAGGWASNGHAVAEAEDLLALCGPCIEREYALGSIQERKTSP